MLNRRLSPLFSDVQWNFDGIFLFDKSGVPASRTSIRNAPTAEQISTLM